MLKSARRDDGVILAIRGAGSAKRLAAQLNISGAAVSAWRSVPPSRVLAIESATGIHRSQLRPDLFATDDLALRALRQIHGLAVIALMSAANPACNCESTASNSQRDDD